MGPVRPLRERGAEALWPALDDDFPMRFSRNCKRKSGLEQLPDFVRHGPRCRMLQDCPVGQETAYAGPLGADTCS